MSIQRADDVPVTHLVRRAGVAEVEYLDVTLRRADDHERKLHIERVHPLRARHTRHRRRRPQVPVLQHVHHPLHMWKRADDAP